MTLSLGFEWRLWALIAVVCLQGAVAAGAPSTGEIRGTVVDARGGEALARVKVRLAEPNTKPSPTHAAPSRSVVSRRPSTC